LPWATGGLLAWGAVLKNETEAAVYTNIKDRQLYGLIQPLINILQDTDIVQDYFEP